MICPDSPHVSICGNQNPAVVHDGFHRADRRRRRELSSSRRRAASSSLAVSGPCCASHSATAASPSRARRARLAAAVNQAETLTPSASAASRTSAWTLLSTVIASLIAGFPRGMSKPYYRSSVVSSASRTCGTASFPQRSCSAGGQTEQLPQLAVSSVSCGTRPSAHGCASAAARVNGSRCPSVLR